MRFLYIDNNIALEEIWRRRDRDRMIVGFTATCVISSYNKWICEFESRSWRSVIDTTLCDKVCQWLVTGLWFSPDIPVSSANETDRHDITEILLKVTLNTTPNLYHSWRNPTVYVYFVIVDHGFFKNCNPITWQLHHWTLPIKHTKISSDGFDKQTLIKNLIVTF